MSRMVLTLLLLNLVGCELKLPDAGTQPENPNPEDPGQNPQEPGDGNSQLFELVVQGGTGSGSYPKGREVTIVADAAPSGSEFKTWSGDVDVLGSATSAQTTLMMPDRAIQVTSTYEVVKVVENALGTVVHIPSSKLLNLAEDLNAKWLRISSVWSFYSNACVPEKMVVHSTLLTSTRDAKNRGFEVFMSLGDTPACASAGNRDGKANNNDVIKDPNLFYHYVKKSVSTFRPMGVKHFGLWNEPNLSQFWEGTSDQVVDLIYEPGRRGIIDGCREAGFSDCLFMGPELAHMGEVDNYLEKLILRMKSKNMVFDILTHHIYNKPWADVFSGDSFLSALEEKRPFRKRRSFLETLRDAGWASSNKTPIVPVWITETGYDEDPPMDAEESELQRKYFQAVMDYQAQRPWWTHTFFYQLKDSGDQLDGFGMARGSGSMMEDHFKKKPSFLEVYNRIKNDPVFKASKLR